MKTKTEVKDGVSMKLYDAIEFAAKELPEGWVIWIGVEKNAGWVNVQLDQSDITNDADLCPDDSLAEQVVAAVKFATNRGTASREAQTRKAPAPDVGKVAGGEGYSAKGDPRAPIPAPPHVRSSVFHLGYRCGHRLPHLAQALSDVPSQPESKIPYVPPVLTEFTTFTFVSSGQMLCSRCNLNFEFIDPSRRWRWVRYPAFCPKCGRPRAPEFNALLPVGNSPLPEGGLPTAADLDAVEEERKLAGES